MTHGYTSFLIRHWQLATGGSRITVEHIQTGETITVASLDAVATWLGAHVAGLIAPDARPPAQAEDAPRSPPA